MRIRYTTMTFVLGAALVAGCSDNSKSDTTSGVTAVPGATGTQVSVIADENSETDWSYTVDPVSVPAGEVTFNFKNAGDSEHEMVILKTDIAFDALEITDNRVSEDDSVGEISETEAGATVSQTFDLEAGNYVLVCNILLHYGHGMRMAFTVTG